MAEFGETLDSYTAVGNREDLSDIIYNISPTETPFMMMAGRGNASSTLHEWQIDTLAAAATDNAVIEGDEVTTGDSIGLTTRLGNRTQISDKVIVISGTQEAVDKAGRKSELAYQLAKKAKELKRDMETTLTQNQAAATGDATTAALLGSLEAWYTTNDSRGGGAGAEGGHSAPGVIAAATDGDTRALTESMVKDVIRTTWDAGGDPTVLMSGPFNKQQISGFTGASTRFDRGEDKRLVAAIDVYVSDFGEHRVIPNRFSRDRTLHVLTPRLFSVDFLRSFRQHPLAKTGDAEKRQLIVEYTLKVANEAGSGVVADLTTS